MKIELNENAFWYLLWSTITALLLGAIVAGLIYTNAKNEKILRADSCIKVVAIEGTGSTGGNIASYLVCKK